MSEHIDRAGNIRSGEELELEPLARYLREHVDEIAANAEIAVEQFPKGHSNLTYLIRSGDKEYVLRRPPFGSKVKSAHDMGREYRVLSKLAPHYPLAPEPLLYCEDDSVIGATFYVMRRIRGVILRRELPAGVTLSEAQTKALHETLIDELVRLHGLDFEAIGLGGLGKPEGYVERQVSGWTKRYGNSKTDEIPSVDQLGAWLAEHLPESGAPALIHNDYKLDNVVLDSQDLTRIVGVLDWEMSTIGDPLMDLGTSLSYWVEATDADEFQWVRWGPTSVPGSLTRTELVARYAEGSGRDVSNVLFYYCFGLFKTAVVLQQIYYRYKHGFTKDERFAPLIHGVRVLANRGVEAIELGHV
ncbi:MAG: phosphotransferase family protein [Myxococcales bacterium]|nr:phosphotransferase family protein [Myxococcales bacterium]